MPASSSTENEGLEDDGAAKSIWFANQVSSMPPKENALADRFQTMDNACATIAMLNMIMNIDGIELDDRLLGFKKESAGLTPLKRGVLITRSGWIRAAHNSFSR